MVWVPAGGSRQELTDNAMDRVVMVDAFGSGEFVLGKSLMIFDPEPEVDAFFTRFPSFYHGVVVEPGAGL
jgi:hypothetical protein